MFLAPNPVLPNPNEQVAKWKASQLLGVPYTAPLVSPQGGANSAGMTQLAIECFVTFLCVLVAQLL